MKKTPFLIATAGVCALSLTTASGADEKQVYQSPLVNKSTPGHAVDIDCDLKGGKKLFLVVTDGGNGSEADWADWIEPRIVVNGVEKKLTDLGWKAASSGWGKPSVNANADGKGLRVAGQDVAYGIGVHANSVIEYDLPEGATRFLAKGGIDNGGSDQGTLSSVKFFVYNAKPNLAVIGAVPSSGGGNRGNLSPEGELAGFEVADGLEASVFAAEPLLFSPSNTDVDARGRVWVCEVVNYRGNAGKRPEGDRILILEDTDADGVLDKQKVFYQGTDMMSPHGICVLGKTTIVSVGDKVLRFTDTNGDDVPDSKAVMFSGISGVQHDHGIHAFTYGPDGKLYFNFGNEGNRLRDKDGKPIIDAAGNEINSDRKPYQQGMVFRCDMDGSNVETLGWNFRNNWEVTVDSFGTMWQSDNDDDGNKGVRINYVMEFGNYGFKDEFTGIAWGDLRTNAESEIPLRHWHLNDPGVVPNLLQTGAGSPTGITIYEGDLLPKVFHNQIIHCDAGPNVVRAYPRKNDGAGYSAEILPILTSSSSGDRWFRPSAVNVAPDGSLIIADWYDPNVGGHGMSDLVKGRLFRVAPPGSKYSVPKFDFATADGAAEALKNPSESVRYLAWTALHGMGEKAEPALKKLWASGNPVYQARALWLLGKIDGKGQQYVTAAIEQTNPDLRIVGLRLARQLKLDVTKVVKALVKDASPQVRRECALALRDNKSPEAPALWAELAAQHDGRDRWYLEALGIGAAGQWDAFLGAYLSKVENDISTPAARDIVWRSRAEKTPDLLVNILKDKATKGDEKLRYMRAFDFQTGPNKQNALMSLLED